MQPGLGCGVFMIGVVTHVYNNGDFDVWFARSKFGATYFRAPNDTTEVFEPGDHIDCIVAEAGRGTVLKARRAVQARAGMRAAANRASADRPAGAKKRPATSGQSEIDFYQE